ncbi:MAG: hypothetical protein COS19_03225 [Flavobacteriaceae bacterium CG02_land_8_20_14_3_00_34_13]|nr:MAG: hypothetical protein COS19_03225 [Flavobacteriaceae bacterium CG02_land_8_20_14_3_00_34_13]
MKKCIVLGIICLFFSCKGTKSTTSASEPATNIVASASLKNFTVEKIARNTTAEDLERMYPDAAKKEEIGHFEEGSVQRAYTIMYPGSKNEIHFIWETLERKKVYQLVLSKNGDWETASGIKIGTTYEDVVQRNGKGINIYGFGWDYSGAVDWNGGALENSKLRVFLQPAGEPNPKFYGDGIIIPNPEELKKLNLTVGKIIYHLGND